MFSSDFKQNNECIDLLTSIMRDQGDTIKEILDLIFKWSFVKLADSVSNTQFCVKLFDFYASLFQYLEGEEYILADFEAAVLLPMLCEKTGLNIAILKVKVKKLIKMVFSVYDKSRCYYYLLAF